jgi:hypothetical protein
MSVPLSANKGGKGLLRSKLPQSFAPPVASATARLVRRSSLKTDDPTIAARRAAQMSDLLAPISKSMTRAKLTCTNGSVRRISLA